MKLAIVGYGRMGRALERLAPARGHRVSLVLDENENADAAGLTADRLADADVVLEFTAPAAAAANLMALARLGCRVVSGTTGWERERAAVDAAFAAGSGALLHSPNFSIGVQLFLRVAEELGRRFQHRPEFQAFVVETHHAGKLDAPSGTARLLAARLRAADPDRPFPVSSIRAGHAPGTHEVAYDAPLETVRLTHEARNRDVFAAGALTAAEWLAGRRGIFTLDQMLFEEAP